MSVCPKGNMWCNPRITEKIGKGKVFFLLLLKMDAMNVMWRFDTITIKLFQNKSLCKSFLSVMLLLHATYMFFYLRYLLILSSFYSILFYINKYLDMILNHEKITKPLTKNMPVISSRMAIRIRNLPGFFIDHHLPNDERMRFAL